MPKNEPNIGALFGTNTAQTGFSPINTSKPVEKPSGEVPQGIKSPTIMKKPVDFNFEDAWKAEGSSGNSVNPNPTQVVKQQAPRIINPMMNNVNVQPNQPLTNPNRPPEIQK